MSSGKGDSGWNEVLESGPKTLLVTGGAGYIGSHTVLELLNKDFEVVVVDNCANAFKDEYTDMPESLRRIEKMTGKQITFYMLDLCNIKPLQKVFQKHNIYCVVHFAGLKAVGESVRFPLLYYEKNVIAAINVLQCMRDNKCRNLIFSSSCTVYGSPDKLPITEETPVGKCTCAYGRTKYFIEQIVQDQCVADPDFNVVSLRYFNPVGAHESGVIGEDPNGIPNCLMPFVAQVATGRREKLSVFGDDYPTVDGTGVRDYVHVVDVAIGHVVALEKMIDKTLSGFKVYNLSLGTAYSVLQMIKAFEKASGVEIPYEIKPRRTGDVAEMRADCSLAREELGWEATRDLDTMCKDLWNFQKNNRNGYAEAP